MRSAAAEDAGHPTGNQSHVFVGTNNPLTRELATVSVATGEITRLENAQI